VPLAKAHKLTIRNTAPADGPRPSIGLQCSEQSRFLRAREANA